MLTAQTTSSNQSHSVQHGEVLDHGLTADRKVTGESSRRRFSSNREPLEEVSSGGVSERAEYFGDVAHGESMSEVSWLAMTYLTNSATTPVQPLE